MIVSHERYQGLRLLALRARQPVREAVLSDDVVLQADSGSSIAG